MEKIALIGANGMLAQAVIKNTSSKFEIIRFDLPEFDITDRDQVLAKVVEVEPDVILNCAAFTNVDGCETEENLATRVNGDGPGYLAEAAKDLGAVLVHVSTDYVFDGSKAEPYVEEDKTNPRSAYGRSKLKGEQAILESGLEKFFIIRTSWLYGPGGKNFPETILRLASEREELRIVSDQTGTPTYTVDLAAAIFQLLNTSSASHVPLHCIYGLYHFSDEGQCSWHGFAEEIVRQARANGMKLKVKTILPIRTEEFPLPAPRPKFSVFSTEKIRRIPGIEILPWEQSLTEYFKIRLQ